MTPDMRAEVRRLVSALCEGEIDAGGYSRLEALLAADADCRRLYLEYVDLHARLLTHPSLGGSPAEAAAMAPPVVAAALPGRRHVSQAVRYTLVAAATLAASLLVQVAWHARPADDRGSAPSVPESAARPEPVYIATLTQAVDCTWDGNGPPRRAGARLLPGDLRLRTGVARVRFDSGPELLVEGPAEVRLESATAARVTRGKIVFKADDTAAPFDLHTPASTLVDFGTEYAVVVGAAGEEVHVFEGEVRRTPNAVPGHAAMERLSAGEARRYTSAASHGGEPTTLQPQRFVRRIARPVQPAPDPTAGLLAYEGFDYRDPDAVEAGRANGGTGWAGAWEPGFARPLNEGDQNRRALNVAESLHRTGAGTPSVGGSFDYTGFTKYFRRLATPVRLDTDGVYYLSFLIRRQGPPADTLNSVSIQLRTTAELEPERLTGVADMRMRLNVGVDRANDLNTHLFRIGSRTPQPLSYGQTYLVIAKVVASRTEPDQVLVRLYAPEEPVGREEPGYWSVVGRPVECDLVFDWLEVHINSKTRQTIDEIRLGTTWAAAAAPWINLPNDQREGKP